MKARPPGWWLLLAYAAFIVYGSLVPLDYKPYELHRAWHDFRNMPFLHLGVESRADWVANGVLYLPLGFLGARAWAARGRAAFAASAVVLLACAALAAAVEFTQLFFPPRTVSQNDLLAEVLGSALGVALVPLLGPWLNRALGAWQAGSSRWGRWGLQLYALGYLALSFFPYDLLLSGEELRSKVASGHVAWGLALEGRGVFLTAVQLFVEVAIVAPLGALLAGRKLRRAPAAGALLGLLIEVGQIFIATGISQGGSVVTRALGVTLGAWLAGRWSHRGVLGLRTAMLRLPAPAWLAVVAAYLHVLFVVNGVLREPWQGFDAALQSWREVQLLPFYYHYYTTEAVALFSLGSVTVMYLPAVLLGWLRTWPRRLVLTVVALLALAVETTKLFVQGMHPDPTNVLIAIVAAALFLRLLTALERLSLLPVAVAVNETAEPASASGGTPSWWLLALVPALGWALAFPVFAPVLTALLVVAALLIWRQPALVWLLVPAALPVLDLAPWSGRFFWNEFDLWCMLCAAVAFHRTAPSSGGGQPTRWVTAGFVLLALSLTLSTLRSLLASPALDANSFSSYYSAYNSVRIVKGAAWALVFCMLWRRFSGHARATWWLGAGMTLGLALTVAVMLWERSAFVSWWDLRSDFRTTGPFSAMHRGGAFIECWLAVASSFALVWTLQLRSRVAQAAAALVPVAAAYAMMLTYSRNGYASLAVVMAGVVLAAWRWRKHEAASPASVWQRRAWGGAIATLMVAVALPVAMGPQSRDRLSRSAADLEVRRAHWEDGLRMRDASWLTALTGMGLGRYPDSHYWRTQEAARAGTYHLSDDGERYFLRLGEGQTLYIDQIIDEPVSAKLNLGVSLRSRTGTPVLGVMLCRKWVLSSLDCVVGTAAAPEPQPGQPPRWQQARIALDATALLKGQQSLPLKLALVTPPRGSIDVTAVSLSDGEGRQLLANGDFAAGMDRWYFSTDVDPPWQLHSLPLTVLFEQGWLGVAAGLLLVGAALATGSRLLWRGQAQVPAALPALAGFMVSGLLNTLIDEPRFLLLLLLLLWLATRASPTPTPARVSPRPNPQALGSASTPAAAA